MRAQFRYVPVLATLALAVACGGGGDPPRRHSTGDSTSIASTVLVALGADGGRTGAELFAAVAGYRSGDLIFVANREDPEILVYDIRGALRSRIGRGGEGPGEFRSIVALLPLGGDSVVALDPILWRVSVFGPRGDFVRSFQIEPSEYGQPVAMGLVNGMLGVASTSRGDPRSLIVGGLTRDSLSVELVPLAEDGIVRVARRSVKIPGSYWRREAAVASVRVRRLLDGPHAMVAFGDSLVVANTSDSPAILAWNAAAWDTLFVDERFGSNDTNSDGVRSPIYWSMAIRAGEIWLADADTVKTGHRVWRGRRLDGAASGSLMLPVDFVIWQLGPDWVLGRRVNADGEVVVELRTLEVPLSR